MPASESQLHLTFTVDGSEAVAIATVNAIPKLVSYASKFQANLQAQREGASRESSAFRSAQSPKPDHPLSAVANAMLHSARARLKEAGTALAYTIRQNMVFSLKTLRLVVFPRTMSDIELAHFVVRDVHAQLGRIVQSETTPAKRELHLSLSSMTTSRFTQLNHSTIPKDILSDDKHWLALLLKNASEATIFDLPSMNMYMKSEEVGDDRSNVILYDFHSKFVRNQSSKDQEDIFITLNVSLYSWLTVLRKNLAREMDQAQGALDYRTGSAQTTVTSPGSPRRKGPDTSTSDPAVKEGQSFRSRTPPLSPHSRAPSLSIPLQSLARLNQSPTAETSDANAFGNITALDSPSRLSSLSKSMDEPAALPTGSVPVIASSSTVAPNTKLPGAAYQARSRHIERLNLRQLGEATPDVMHPFFMKKAGFSLEDSLPQYVHEYATMPIEEIMRALLKLYSKQLSSSID